MKNAIIIVLKRVNYDTGQYEFLCSRTKQGVVLPTLSLEDVTIQNATSRFLIDVIGVSDPSWLQLSIVDAYEDELYQDKVRFLVYTAILPHELCNVSEHEWLDLKQVSSVEFLTPQAKRVIGKCSLVF